MSRRALAWASVGALFCLIASSPSLPAPSPSFDCAKASAADERAICAEPQLADLDRLIADGYAQLVKRFGSTVANRLHLPLLRARHACGGNSFCIFQIQSEEMPLFTTLGISVEPPKWLAASVPSYDALKRMLKVGECTAATVQEVSYRLCSPDESNVCIPSAGSGSSITLSNGIYGVDYEAVPQVHASEIGDPVIACLASVPSDCPPGDDRGYVWSVRNLRTGGKWQLPDAEHMCGGA